MRAIAIRNLYPNVITTRDNEKECYDINGRLVSVDKSLVEEEFKRLVLENEYKFKRAAEYPSLTDQLDMQYHDSVNGTTTWLDAVNAVKAKYPKP